MINTHILYFHQKKNSREHLIHRAMLFIGYVKEGTLSSKLNSVVNPQTTNISHPPIDVIHTPISDRK